MAQKATGRPAVKTVTALLKACGCFTVWQRRELPSDDELLDKAQRRVNFYRKRVAAQQAAQQSA